MGSKKLKAIVLDGNSPIDYIDKEKFLELNRKLPGERDYKMCTQRAGV